MSKSKFTSRVLTLTLMVMATGVRAQFFGGGDYPRLKLGGPLGQLIGGGGGSSGGSSSSASSGLGQVLSSLLSSASSSSNSGSPLQQLATAASTSYINAIRAALPFGQYGGGGGGGGGQGQAAASMHSHHGNPSMHYGAASQQIFNTLPNPMGLLGGGNEAPSFYGANFDSLGGFGADNLYGGQGQNHHQGGPGGYGQFHHHQQHQQHHHHQAGHGFGSAAYSGPGQYNVQDMDGKK